MVKQIVKITGDHGCHWLHCRGYLKAASHNTQPMTRCLGKCEHHGQNIATDTRLHHNAGGHFLDVACEPWQQPQH